MIESWEKASRRLPCPNQVEWFSSVSIAIKESCDFHLCFVYCPLNDDIIEDTYRLPRVDNLLNIVSGRPLYSVLDHFADSMQSQWLMNRSCHSITDIHGHLHLTSDAIRYP